MLSQMDDFFMLSVSIQKQDGLILYRLLKFLENEPFKMTLFCYCYLENKTKTTCEVQYDDKDITMDMDVDTSFELYGLFEFMAEVKHSISLLHQLGLPFFLQVINHRSFAVL